MSYKEVDGLRGKQILQAWSAGGGKLYRDIFNNNGIPTSRQAKAARRV